MNTALAEPKTSMKMVGSNGQISIGKQHAGRQVLVEEQAPGVWLIRTARVIPDNELWLHAPQAQASLQAAMEWSVNNKPRSTSIDMLHEESSHGIIAKHTPRQTRSQQPRVSKKPVRTRQV